MEKKKLVEKLAVVRKIREREIAAQRTPMDIEKEEDQRRRTGP